MTTLKRIHGDCITCSSDIRMIQGLSLIHIYHAADTLDKLHVFVEGDATYTGVPWIMQDDVRTVPEWISRIREQLSVSYAGDVYKRQSYDTT